MTYNVTFYKNTGYNKDNIPDRKELLEDSRIIKLNVDAIWVYQNQELAGIRVASNFTDIYSVDYCKIDNAYYFVTGITMINPQTVQVNLEIDAVTTIGLKNITNNIIGGWCTRRSVTDDTLLSNNIQEDFIPAEPLQIDFVPFKVNMNGANAQVIIASSIDLDKIEEFEATTYNDMKKSLSVTVPKMPPVVNGTSITIFAGQTNFNKILPNVKLYHWNKNNQTIEKYANALAILWSLGMIDSITSMYNIPGGWNYVYDNSESGGLVSITVDGRKYDVDSTIPIKWNYNAVNNKVFCDQFNKVNVASFSSGDELDFNPSDICTWADNSFNFYFWFDPSPQGKTFFRPRTFQGLTGKDDDIYFQTISGAVWPNTQVLFDGAQGWSVNKKLYDLTREQQGYSGFFNLVDSIGNIAKMAAGADTTKIADSWRPVSTGKKDDAFRTTYSQMQTIPTLDINGIVGNAQRGINLDISKRQNKINYIADNNLVSPTIKFPRDNSLVDLIGNGFMVLRSRLSENDSKRFDRYLTEYGYAVNEPLTKDCFYGRKFFNYIECTDITVGNLPMGDNDQPCPLRLKELALKQLEGGIRIWHTRMYLDAYDNNPIGG